MNMRHAHRWASVAIACVVVAIAGCDKGTQGEAQSVADDAIITTQVHAKAAAIDAATVSLLHVKSERGAVTLTGTIKTQSERVAIEKAARSVSGVHSVDDQIVVDANAPTGKEIEADLELAARIHTALIAQTGVNAARVHVDVHHGVVTLTGSLPSAAHREVADQTVRTVPGVAKVIDKIAISKT